jgi:hypothetical protein
MSICCGRRHQCLQLSLTIRPAFTFWPGASQRLIWLQREGNRCTKLRLRSHARCAHFAMRTGSACCKASVLFLDLTPVRQPERAQITGAMQSHVCRSLNARATIVSVNTCLLAATDFAVYTRARSHSPSSLEIRNAPYYSTK